MYYGRKYFQNLFTTIIFLHIEICFVNHSVQILHIFTPVLKKSKKLERKVTIRNTKRKVCVFKMLLHAVNVN